MSDVLHVIPFLGVSMAFFFLFNHPLFRVHCSSREDHGDHDGFALGGIASFVGKVFSARSSSDHKPPSLVQRERSQWHQTAQHWN
jgi:hypothetical protein